MISCEKESHKILAFYTILRLGTAYSKIFHICMDVRWCTILLEDGIYVMIILGNLWCQNVF
jgi:hypothetical protein